MSAWLIGGELLLLACQAEVRVSCLAVAAQAADVAVGVDRHAALAVVAVAVVSTIISYQHAYGLVRLHGDFGMTARLLPFTVDGLIWAASRVALDASRRNLPVPRLAAWSLGAGIVATVGGLLGVEPVGAERVVVGDDRPALTDNATAVNGERHRAGLPLFRESHWLPDWLPKIKSENLSDQSGRRDLNPRPLDPMPLSVS